MTMAACPGCMGSGRHNWVPGSCQHATDELGYADPVSEPKCVICGRPWSECKLTIEQHGLEGGWPFPADEYSIPPFSDEDWLDSTVEYPASHETKERIFRAVNYEDGIACSDCPYEDNTCQVDGCEQEMKWPDDFRGFGTNVKPKGQK